MSTITIFKTVAVAVLIGGMFAMLFRKARKRNRKRSTGVNAG